MKLNYRKILAANVDALMDATPALSSHAKLATRCSTAIRKIGARTIGHLCTADGPQPRLDTIVAVAEAFRIEPWLLLMPDFDATSRRSRESPPRAVIELARRITDLPKERRDLLLSIFGSEGIPDDAVALAGENVPVLHSPPGSQYRIKRSPKKT